MTKEQKEIIKKILSENFNHYSVKGNIFTVKESYFYKHGRSPETLFEDIKKIIPEAILVEKDDVWKPWPKDSYFIVKFTV